MKLKQRLVCGVSAFLVTSFVVAVIFLSQGQVYLDRHSLSLEDRAGAKFSLQNLALVDAAEGLNFNNKSGDDKDGILLRRQLDKSVSRSGANKSRPDPVDPDTYGDKTNNGGEFSNSSAKQVKLLKSENLNRTWHLNASSERHIAFQPGKGVIAAISSLHERPVNLPEEGNFYNIPHKHPHILTVPAKNRSKLEALFRNFNASYRVPRGVDKHDQLVRFVHKSSDQKPKIWEQFQLGINRYEIYSYNNSMIDELLKYVAESDIKKSVEKVGGTQVKLFLTFLDDGGGLMKPWRVPRDYETLPDHFYFSDIERHNAEIAAFHLDRILDFRRVPPVAGRWFNLSSDVYYKTEESLRKTFFRSPANNLCFVGHCSYYCESETAVCGRPDMIEGSVAAFLPSFKQVPRKTWRHPWRRSYSKHRTADWEHDLTYCTRIVMKKHPYSSGRRLLDLMDMAIFDFLIGNMDRHHYETFDHFGNFTYPIHLDHGRAFGKHQTDEVSILAPLFQCCILRRTTYDRLVLLSTDEYRLSDVLRESLSADLVSPVLYEPHYAALDRRLRTVHKYIDTCFTNAGSKDEVLKAEPLFKDYREPLTNELIDDSEIDDVDF